MTETENWGIILNAKSGDRRSGRKNTVSDKLKEAGFAGIYCRTEYPGHATELARQMVNQGCRQFIVVGGDGSVSETIDGLMTSCVDSRQLTFGIIPSGTGNDWARYWNIGKKVETNIHILQQGKTAAIDVGQLSYLRKRQEVTKYFINSVGIGFDAQVVEQAERIGKVFRGQSWIYSLALLSSTFIHRSKLIELRSNEEVLLNDKVYTMSIANGPYTGGGIKQTPKADPTDGMLEVMAATKLNPVQLVKGLHSVLSRSYDNPDGIIRRFQSQQLNINTQQRLKIEADGILQKDSKAPLSISIVPAAINMIVP